MAHLGFNCIYILESTELVKSMHNLNLKVHVYTFKNDDDLAWKYFQVNAKLKKCIFYFKQVKTILIVLENEKKGFIKLLPILFFVFFTFYLRYLDLHQKLFIVTLGSLHELYFLYFLLHAKKICIH